jgi:hypothetical protein
MVHLVNQLHEATQERRFLQDTFKKEQDERRTKETKDRK